MARHDYRRLHLRKRDGQKARKKLADKRLGLDCRPAPKRYKWGAEMQERHRKWLAYRNWRRSLTSDVAETGPLLPPESVLTPAESTVSVGA